MAGAKISEKYTGTRAALVTLGALDTAEGDQFSRRYVPII